MTGQIHFTNDCETGFGACEKGATFNHILTWKINDIAINLTGMTGKMQVRKNVNAEPILELSTENFRMSFGGVAGTIELLISAYETSLLTPAVYVYDLLINTGSKVERLIYGKFEVIASVTHE